MGEWFERNRGYVVLMLVNLALLGGLFFWLRRPVSTPVEIIPPEPTPSPAPTSTATAMPLRVYITGAVLHPDVYRLAPGCIVKDAIDAAGGVTGDADLVRINLAQELHDQQQVYVPRIGEADAPPPVTGGTSAPSSSEGVPGGKVNINTATLEELDTLPGIGPALAEGIMEFREANGPFKSIEEITLVSGIGQVTFEKMKDRISVGE
jgi:competence protein ComEA